jgi:hypothetical protein
VPDRSAIPLSPAQQARLHPTLADRDTWIWAVGGKLDDEGLAVFRERCNRRALGALLRLICAAPDNTPHPQHTPIPGALAELEAK